MSYLARYEAGEHEAVWAELRALGPAACNGNMMIEAKKVADATMRRVLSNLQRIEAGLRAAGYQFASAGSQPLDADAAVTAALRGADETLQGLGLLPGAAAQILKSIRQTLGKTPALPLAEGTTQVPHVRESALGDPDTHLEHLDRYEDMAGTAPLALGSFWRTIGWVDFSGQLPRKAPLPRTVVPLVIMPPAMLADDYEAHVDDNGDGTGFIVDLTDLAHPDAREPLAGVYMSPAADVRLPSGEWFVDFLRRTTRAAALPGLAAEQLPGLADVAAAWEPF